MTGTAKSITAVVEKIVEGGLGLIRSDQGVVFCRGVIPGETVEVELLATRRGVLWGRLIRVIDSSPERRDPECPHFSEFAPEGGCGPHGGCGGCDFMHMTRAAEIAFKASVTRETLARMSGREIPADFIGAPPPPLGYRNTVRLQGEAGALGFFRSGTKEIVDIADCVVAEESIRGEIRRWKKSPDATMPRTLTIRAASGDASHSALSPVATRGAKQGECVDAGESVTIRLRGRDFRVSIGSFFQINTGVAGNLIDCARAELPRGRRLFDLFAGVGTFAISLADRYDEVYGFEISRSAIGDFRVNAEGLSGLRIEEWDAARGFRREVEAGDAVILDPPRIGLPRRLRDEIAGWRPHPAIAYVSCDAATLGRDLKALLDSGYALRSPVRLFDMFPRTAHVEMMAFLE